MQVIKQLLKNKNEKKKWQQQLELIRRSDYFDASYYLQQNPDVASAGLDAAEHFLKYGGFEGRKPSERFDPEFYLDTYPDVAESGLNPLLHFLRYGQAEQRETLAPSAVSGPDTEQVSIDSGVQLLQLLLLQGQYQAFSAMLAQLSAHQLTADPERQQWLDLLQAEAWLAQGQLAECEAWLKSQRTHALYWYYSARLRLLQGKPEKATQAAQSFVYQSPKSAEGVFLVADCALASGQQHEAISALSQFALQSRRARSWLHFANSVHNQSSLNQYLNQLRQWCLQKPNARYNPDVSLATAAACLQGGNPELAKQVLHDCIAFHQSRKNGFKVLQQPDLRFSQQLNLPLWPMPFQALPAAQALNCQPRMLAALQQLYATLTPIGIQPFLLLSTLKTALQGQEDFDASSPLYLGIAPGVELPELMQALNQSPYFYPPQQQGSSLCLTHSNGIQLTLLYQQQQDGKWHFELAGARFSTSPVQPVPYSLSGVELLVPAAAEEYLHSFSDQWPQKGFDFVLHSLNRSIVQQDSYSLYCYQRLLTALLAEDSITEVQMLRELGKYESKASYQQLVGSNYTIPTLEQIKADGVKVVLYVTGLEKVAYQGNMWIPVLEQLPVPAAIVLREKQTATDLIKTHLPVYFMSSMRELELLDEAGVKTILYPANTQKNVQTLRFHTMNHFFINHGDSDKVVNQSKFLMAYDKLLVAGPLAEQRIRNAGLPVRENQIEHVGRPQVELMLSRGDGVCRQIKTILYAPTWEGFVEEANYSSVNALGYAMLLQLLQQGSYKVLFKPHPYTGYNKNGDCGEFLEKMRALASDYPQLELVDIDSGIHPWMNASDLLITDISSVLNDYLHTLKPIILMNPKGFSEDELSQQYPSSKASYVFNKGDEIVTMLKGVATQDSKQKLRVETCKLSLGDFPNGAMQRFTEVVLDSVQ